MNPKTISTKSLEFIHKNGWQRFSPGALAIYMDVPLSFIKVHLPDKEALISLLWTTLRQQVEETLSVEDLLEVSPQERLQEVFLCYLDILAPHKKALKEILKNGWHTPTVPFVTAKGWCCETHFILNYAHLSTSGPLGRAKINVLSALYAAAFIVWLNDSSKGMDKTMPFLDKYLTWCSRQMARYT